MGLYLGEGIYTGGLYLGGGHINGILRCIYIKYIYIYRKIPLMRPPYMSPKQKFEIVTEIVTILFPAVHSILQNT